MSIGPPVALPGVSLPFSLEVGGISNFFGIVNVYGNINQFALKTAFGAKIANSLSLKNGVDLKNAVSLGNGVKVQNVTLVASGAIASPWLDQLLLRYAMLSPPKGFDMHHWNQERLEIDTYVVLKVQKQRYIFVENLWF